jgi:hypothetical protein
MPYSLGLTSLTELSREREEAVLHSSITEFAFFFLIHLFTYAYIVWVISPPCSPPPPFPPFLPQFQADSVLPLSLVLLKKRDKRNNEDKVFLLVKDTYSEIFLALLSCTRVMTHVDSSLTDLYSGY